MAAETKTKGGVLIPEKAQGKVLTATVRAVGPGALNEVINDMKDNEIFIYIYSINVHKGV